MNAIATAHSIFTHNGTLTVENPATGNHRTFKVRIIPTDSDFAPGERVVGLLTGSDNTRDYTWFGFVKKDRVIVWKNKRGGVYDTYADMLVRPEVYEAERGVIYHWEHVCCRRCGRDLTTPESLTKGIGPTCEGLER